MPEISVIHFITQSSCSQSPHPHCNQSTPPPCSTSSTYDCIQTQHLSAFCTSGSSCCLAASIFVQSRRLPFRTVGWDEVCWMTCQVELHSAFSSITPLLDMLFLLPFSLSFFLSLNLLLQFPFLLLFLLLLFLLSHSLSILFLFFLLRLSLVPSP